MSDERSLWVIEADLNEATDRLADASAAESVAIRRATDALNEVNRLQRELDRRIMLIRARAICGSDWHARDKHMVKADLAG